MVNKPAGVVHGPRLAGAQVELVDRKRRLYPVGRPDADSIGVILLTNDGELANRLTHPRYGVKRTYRVKAGPRTRPRSAVCGRASSSRTDPRRPRGAPISPRVLELTIADRQVRRMVEAVGNEVVPSWFGSGSARQALGELPEGQRRLRPPEVKRLWKDARPDER